MQLPLKNITNINIEEDSKSFLESINQVEPNVFSDYSNPLLQHVAIFKSLLEKVNNGEADDLSQ